VHYGFNVKLDVCVASSGTFYTIDSWACTLISGYNSVFLIFTVLIVELVFMVFFICCIMLCNGLKMGE